ncbi:hypothetical protein [Aquimarina sp. AU474]|uniref:hypothetical protein n=1 Tax=Aquimarina sp. AU474 TaxID=2108529 RepID=UPI000D68AAFA|nr:hypothetical protein [Aquimarina sp. AU474]
MKKIVLLTLLIISIGCSEDNDLVNSNTTPIITIIVDEGVASTDQKLFYVVKGENGENLGHGQLFNLDKIKIEKSYSGTNIALTIFKHLTFNNTTKAQSYTDIRINNTIKLINTFFPSPASNTMLKLDNYPNDFSEIILAQLGRFSPLNFKFEETFSYAFSESAPLLVISTSFLNQIPKYQTMDLNENSNPTINLDNSIDMENKHTINTSSLGTIGDFNYTTELSGLIDKNVDSTAYKLYVDRNPDISANEISLYTPSIFERFRLILTAYDQNATYSQNTRGGIPSSFNIINPDITIVNNAFENTNIQISGDQISYLRSTWQLKNNSGLLWKIVSPKEKTGNYNLQDVPEMIIQEIGLSTTSDSYMLSAVEVVNVDNLNYLQSIDRLFKSDQTESLLILSKYIEL